MGELMYAFANQSSLSCVFPIADSAKIVYSYYCRTLYYIIVSK